MIEGVAGGIEGDRRYPTFPIHGRIRIFFE
jgi:hypothetical protein